MTAPSRAQSSLFEYAEAKRLPVEFLRDDCCLQEIQLGADSALAIPYRDQGGAEVATRFRFIPGVKGDRFRWKNGSSPVLYGLWRDVETEHVVLVEGESDAQTLWFHGIPALGIPGAGTWNDSWAEHLHPDATIYVVIEPDAGGQTLGRKLSNSPIRDRLRLIHLDGHKDVSELHVDDPDMFTERWESAVQNAEVVPATLKIEELLDLAGPLPSDASATEIGKWLERVNGAQRAHPPSKWSLFRSAVIGRVKLVKGVSGPAGIVDEALERVTVSDFGGDIDSDAKLLDPIPPEVRERALKLLSMPDLLDIAANTMTLGGLLGEDVNRRVVFLSCIAGCSGDPIHLAIHGESSAGKNTLVRAATDLLPTDKVLAVTGLSKHALAYRGGRIEGAFVIDEAEGQVGAEYSMRIAMSEGRVTRLTVNHGESGQLEAQELEVEVAASIITTTTALALHAENQTRLLDLHVDESSDLTRAILNAAADRAAGSASPRSAKLIDTWRAAVSMLEAVDVVIPFAGQIAAEFPDKPVRARRDFKKVLALIEACAFLHQFSRKRDAEDRVVASVEDYGFVYPLIQAVIGPSMTGLTPKARQIYGLVKQLSKNGHGWVRRIDIEEAARGKVASRVTVHRWTKRLTELGILEAQKEDGAWKYKIVRDLDTEAIPLPKPEDISTS